MHRLPMIAFLWATACTPKEPASTDSASDETGAADTGLPDGGEPGPDPSFVFTFAVMADAHVTGPGEHLDRLSAAREWVQANAEERHIELAFVLGDIGWGGGLPHAHDALRGLSMPWVPVLGDNEIQAEEEAAFNAEFLSQFAALDAQVTDLSVADIPVYNPEWEHNSWLQNVSFSHRGVRFLSVDWSSRDVGGIMGETPDLHDFDGGTWPWLTERLVAEGAVADEGVVLLSHMPLFAGIGGLDVDEATEVQGLFSQHAGALHANYAGHLHGNSEEPWAEAGIDRYVTDALWDDELTVRLVEVWSDGSTFTYQQELIVIE